MLRPVINIKITQITPYTYIDINGISKTINRNSVLDLDFVNEYVIDDGWETDTSNCTIKFPKNVVLQTNDYLFKQAGTYNVVIGGTTNIKENNNPITVAPLLMRGDLVSIIDGYRFFNAQNIEKTITEEVYKGYITKINSDIPIEIECEDNFYLLKRVPIGITKFSGSLTDLCKNILDSVNNAFYKKNPLYPKLSLTNKLDSLTTKFSLGYLDIDYETSSCAMILNKIRTKYHIESFFVGDVLYFGNPIYDESRANSQYFFNFQNNIKENKLEYINKQDLVISAVVSCQIINKTGKETKLGLKSTKKERLQVFVYWDIITDSFKWIKIDKGDKIPPNEGGERHDFKFPVDLSKPQPTVNELAEFGINNLKQYYYTGFKGNFTSIGFPRIKWNDNINLVNDFIADNNGQYKVKRVTRRGGVKGIKQQIYIAYRQNVDLPKNTYELSMI